MSFSTAPVSSDFSINAVANPACWLDVFSDLNDLPADLCIANRIGYKNISPSDLHLFAGAYGLAFKGETPAFTPEILQGVKVLRLEDCPEPIDLAMFVDIPKLSLAGCEWVTDVSLLKNVVSLDISGTKVTDVSMLKNVVYLNISETAVANVEGLPALKTLIAQCCDNLCDVNHLHYVQVLDVCGCELVKDISNLGELSELYVTSCLRITDFSSVRKVPTLMAGSNPNF